jgi:hypothetical protein
MAAFSSFKCIASGVRAPRAAPQISRRIAERSPTDFAGFAARVRGGRLDRAVPLTVLVLGFSLSFMLGFFLE